MLNRRVRHLNPAQCGTGCQVVLDARTITPQTDNTTLETWVGRSGTSINATQATALQRPVYRSSSISGRPAVQFDGASTNYNLAALAVTNGASSGMAIGVVVVDAISDNPANMLFTSTGTGSTSTRWSVRASVATAAANSAWRRTDAGSAATTANTGTTSATCVLQSFADWANNALVTSVNGVDGATQTNPDGAGTVSATNALACRIGALSSSVNRLGGRIGAVVIAVPALPAPLRKRIRQSLGYSFRIATA